MLDTTTRLKFRNRLADQGLAKTSVDTVNAGLRERGLQLKKGTVVDATILAVPSFKKNKGKARDPEMHQTRQGNRWHFGMTSPIGADGDSGLAHCVIGATTNVAAATQVALCRTTEEVDAGQPSAAD